MTDKDKLIDMGFILQEWGEDEVQELRFIGLDWVIDCLINEDNSISSVFLNCKYREYIEMRGITTPEQVRELLKFITGK
jgi:hypothetical protein